jgi:hypothetical protein
MKTLISVVALVAFVAGTAVPIEAFAQAPGGGAPPPAANAPAMAPTTPTAPETAPAKSTAHKSTHKSAKKKTHTKSTKSSKKTNKPPTQGSLKTAPNLDHTA